MKHGSLALNFHSGPKTFLRESMSDLKSHWFSLCFLGDKLINPMVGGYIIYLLKFLAHLRFA